MYHQLGGLFRHSCVVAELPDAAWVQPALRFKPPRHFGLPVPTLRAAYLENGQNELVISSDGRFGFWRDETYADSETLVIAELTPPSAPRRA